jgi:hypothetical protein
MISFGGLVRPPRHIGTLISVHSVDETGEEI